MLRTFFTTIALISILIPLGGCAQKPAATGVIVVGDISLDATEARRQRFQPIADYLAAKLGKVGIGIGAVKIAPDKETMAQWMTSGEVDIYFDSLYPAMFVIEQSGGQAILRRWKDGVAEYQSLFIARQDSNLTSLSELQGKKIALDEPSSTSGYMLPMAHLLKASIKPIELGELAQAVATEQVGYIFAGKDANLIKWVIEGKVTAGVIDSESFRELPVENRAQLSILDRTAAFPRQVVVIRPGIEPTKLEAIKTILMNMDENREGKALLEDFQETAQFDEFPQGAAEALERMQESYDLVLQYNQN